MATTQRARRLLGSTGRPGIAGLATAAPLSTVDASRHPVGTIVGLAVLAVCAILVIGVPLAGALINRHRRRALAAALAAAAARPRPLPPRPVTDGARPPVAARLAAVTRPAGGAGWLAGRPVAPGWETAPAAEYGSSLPVRAAPVR
jgi:hypothetical protein